MTGLELYEIWAPPISCWARWVKPLLFAEMKPALVLPLTEATLPPVAVPTDAHAAVIVELPGVESVRQGLALVQAGYRPIPLYNGAIGPAQRASPGPLSPPASPVAGATAVSLEPLLSAPLVPVEPLLPWLMHGAKLLSPANLAYDAPPAFLIDANRRQAAAATPGRYDNRWIVFPQDFPSAAFLKDHGITRVMLLQDRGQSQPADDLAHVLLRWQGAGIELLRSDQALGPQPQPLLVNRPSHFKAPWYRILATLGLRRNSAGGFGGVIPEPSSG